MSLKVSEIYNNMYEYYTGERSAFTTNKVKKSIFTKEVPNYNPTQPLFQLTREGIVGAGDTGAAAAANN